MPSEQPVKLSIHPVVLFFYMGVLKDFCFMPVILIKILRLRHPRIRQPVPDTVPGILSRMYRLRGSLRKTLEREGYTL